MRHIHHAIPLHEAPLRDGVPFYYTVEHPSSQHRLRKMGRKGRQTEESYPWTGEHGRRARPSKRPSHCAALADPSPSAGDADFFRGRIPSAGPPLFPFSGHRTQQGATTGRAAIKAREAHALGEKFFEPRKTDDKVSANECIQFAEPRRRKTKLTALEKSFHPRSLNAYALSLTTHYSIILGDNGQIDRMRGC